MRILLVDEHELVCDGLTLLLNRMNPTFHVSSVRNHAECLAWLDKVQCDLILFDLGNPGQESNLDALKEIVSRQGERPVVALVATCDLETIVNVLGCGASGVIPKTSSTAMTMHAIQIVAAGGVYMPPPETENQSLVARCRRHSTQDDIGQTSAPSTVSESSVGLTDRQFDVLQLMMIGLPNKLIARQLKLSEATVKAHVSAVLRAFNVTSRTQAAVLFSQKHTARDIYHNAVGSRQ